MRTDRYDLDNAVFQPFVVEGAVQIHPLGVFIGHNGGSMLFGFAGLISGDTDHGVAKELNGHAIPESLRITLYYLIILSGCLF